jgi:CBS domain containing-hemolysin-like protein
VPEYVPLNELLHQMQRSAQEMVMVVDEFGGTAGLITIQDLVAEIIGTTYEPEDEEEPTIQILNEQTFLVQAQLDIQEVNEMLNLDLPMIEDYQTVGGFMIYELQKIPAIGEQLRYANYELTVMLAEGPRLHQIQIQRLDRATANGTSTADEVITDYWEESVAQSNRPSQNGNYDSSNSSSEVSSDK